MTDEDLWILPPPEPRRRVGLKFHQSIAKAEMARLYADADAAQRRARLTVRNAGSGRLTFHPACTASGREETAMPGESAQVRTGRRPAWRRAMDWIRGAIGRAGR